MQASMETRRSHHDGLE